MSYFVRVMAVVGMLAVGGALWADAPEREKLCQACHGARGGEPIMDMYPKLAGQNKAYLIGALKAYRAGQRTGGMSAVMSPQTANLTDAEIDQLADYYSKQ